MYWCYRYLFLLVHVVDELGGNETTYLLVFELAAGEIRSDSERAVMGHLHLFDGKQNREMWRTRCGRRKWAYILICL